MGKMTYPEWKQRFEDASNADYKAWKRCCELDNSGKSSTPEFRILEKQQREYAELKKVLVDAYPEYERKRLSEPQ